MSGPSRLRVLMSGVPAGWLSRASTGRVELVYDPGYAVAGATPLSTGLPVLATRHTGRHLNAWLANLLPDNELVLARWAARFQVSASSPFALLAHVGADCAGAVQFITEDRLDGLDTGGLAPVSQTEIGNWLAVSATDPAAWNPGHEGGQFSLAGAQPKLALRRDDQGNWFQPWGVEPTTHIIKPPMPGLAHQQLNEHLCLQVARRMGLPAAASQITTFADRQAIVVTRYDRTTSGSRMLRVHQEDLCQALGVPPTRKYQAQGGPGPVEVVALLRRTHPGGQADTVVDRFVDALALSWVLGATDAHAKNYSLLLAGPNVRLAPLYDINSVLPYLSSSRRDVALGQVSIHTARLAMTIGGRARLTDIDRQAWTDLAQAIRLQPQHLLDRVAQVVAATESAAAEVTTEHLDSGGLDPAQQLFTTDLGAAIRARAGHARSALLGRTTTRRQR